MASPSKPPLLPKQPRLDTVTQNDMPSSSAPKSSGNTQRRIERPARATTSAPEFQTIPQNPSHSLGPTRSLAVLQEMARPLTPPMMAGNASNTEIGESSSNMKKSTGMPYQANAMPPATRQQHSIYPVNSQGRKSVHPQPSTDHFMRPRTMEEWNKASDEDLQVARERERMRIGFQMDVYRQGMRLQAEKESRFIRPSGPNAATLESTNRPDQNFGNQSNVIASGSLVSRAKSQATPGVDPMLTDWDDGENDFTMFDDTPKDRSMVEETEEVVFPPFNLIEPDYYPSVSALSSMTKWEPKLDEAYQIDAQLNFDLRFQIPQTPADKESLQQALDITRMDFWIRNPLETYPPDFPQYKTESYMSQQRRLQHAFCRFWQEYGSGPPPELYRLPNWMFGFDKCYWTPSRWGLDLRSNAYNQGLGDMAAAKNEHGLRCMDRRGWKARLEEQVAAATAHCTTELALYAGPKKT